MSVQCSKMGVKYAFSYAFTVPIINDLFKSVNQVKINE